MRKPITDFQFVLLLGALSMIGPFAIDTLFPAFPVAGKALGVSQAMMQQTISSYLFAFAIGSLLHGPLSDSFGRRPVVVTCIVGFVLGSFGCWFATDFSTLLCFRAVQGFCAAGGTVISRALVRDRFDGARAQQATSQITLVFLLGPAVAPLIGGLILQFAGGAQWRLIFAFITLYSVVVAIALLLKLNESHPKANRLEFSAPALLHSYLTIFRSQAAIWLILAAAFNFSGLFLIISSAPAIVFGLWQLGTLDLWKLFVFAMGGILLGSQLSGYVATRWSHARTIGVGYSVMTCACVAHIAYGAVVTQPSWPLAAVPMLLYAAGSSLAYPSLTVLLMDRFPERRGAAASLQTFVSLGFNGLVAGTVSPLVAGTTLKLAGAQGLIMLAGLVTYALFVLSQKRLQHSVDETMEVG